MELVYLNDKNKNKFPPLMFKNYTIHSIIQQSKDYQYLSVINLQYYISLFFVAKMFIVLKPF